MNKINTDYLEEHGFCQNCNVPTKVHAKFCNYCGTEVQPPIASKVDHIKPCPYCAEAIKEEAIKCRFCGSDLITKPAIGQIRHSPNPASTQKNKLGGVQIGCLSMVGMFLLVMLIAALSPHQPGESISTSSEVQNESTNEANDQSTTPQASPGVAAITRPSDIGLTIDELRNRFDGLAQKAHYPLKLSTRRSDGNSDVTGYWFDLEPPSEIRLIAGTDTKTRRVRSVMMSGACLDDSKRFQVAGDFLVALTFLMQAIDPELTIQGREDILTKLGLDGEDDTGCPSANKKFVTNGREYQLISSESIPLTVSISPYPKFITTDSQNR